jgi:hypothetical protein
MHLCLPNRNKAASFVASGQLLFDPGHSAWPCKSSCRHWPTTRQLKPSRNTWLLGSWYPPGGDQGLRNNASTAGYADHGARIKHSHYSFWSGCAAFHIRNTHIGKHSGVIAMSLSEGHTFVLCSYLRFTRYKREQHAREVAQCVEDASDKLPDGVRLLCSSMPML